MASYTAYLFSLLKRNIQIVEIINGTTNLHTYTLNNCCKSKSKVTNDCILYCKADKTKNEDIRRLENVGKYVQAYVQVCINSCMQLNYKNYLFMKTASQYSHLLESRISVKDFFYLHFGYDCFHDSTRSNLVPS